MTQVFRDKNTSASANGAAGLPVWDLSALYSGRDGADLTESLAGADRDARAFRDRYAGKVVGLKGDGLADAIATYEAIDETLTRVMAFAYLEYAGDMSDAETGRFFQSMQEQVNDIAAQLIFFGLEINQIEDEPFAALQDNSAALAAWRPWLRDKRVYRPHQLSDEAERLLHDKRVTGRSAWTRLFDETIAALRFPMDGPDGTRDLTEAEALHLLSSADRSERKRAAESIAQVFQDNIRLFAHVTNTLAKDKETEDKWRHHARPVSSRNLGNHVEDEVVDALAGAVQAAYPDLSHRYYALKAKWLGLEKLEYWDRNAPLPDADHTAIPWPQAQRMVLDAYRKFSAPLADTGARFFDENWIDAQVRPGKASGAFSHPTVPSAHPYILLNYQGKTRDVMTLAHELGHGVHQVLAYSQGHLMANTPLTLAETASVFGEMLTFRSLLGAAETPEKRRMLLAGKVEDMLNTVVRQIAFYEFERRVHDARREGELLAEQIGEIWMAVQHESLGPAFHFDPGYQVYWAYIPHFIHSPFYVYAYAFGDCLVNSLYAAYQDANAAGDGADFAARYLEMLSAGGTLRHRELLAPFGLDASDPAFWDKGLGMIRGFIDELETE